MATKTDSTTLKIAPREIGHSRATRRLRRAGSVPGVLYGLDRENLTFSVDALELRHALAARGAVLEVDLDGQTTNAVVKQSQVHPVRGEITHIDLVRVDVNKPIEAQVTIVLVGSDDSPGVKEGGILEQPTREVTVEALPNDIPEAIEYDASTAEMNDTVFLDGLTAPAGVTLILDELAGETPLFTITPPRTQADLDELETETEVVGEDAKAKAGGDEAAEGDSSE
ncbi:MAG: ribosomal rRNA E-loop binding protein Ctc/L25/TL5 [Solirubrobacterales bacterium]|jgi:large subunit ribosomal protein L25|nr:ribosomal rRNA E-loop binding protein Ctc/L25/TL5 [Solirubrobacterales bacterium]